MSSVEVDGVLGLHDPTGGAELRVDGIAGDLFGILIEHGSVQGLQQIWTKFARTCEGNSIAADCSAPASLRQTVEKVTRCRFFKKTMRFHPEF